ncbi:MAG: hypothetical protein MJ252_04900, partial [archaeon]|nr:hypothetical protein [archaeon]
MSLEIFIKAIDFLWFSNSVSKEEFKTIFENNDILYNYFLSVLKEFNPKDSVFILGNPNNKDLDMILNFGNNCRTILSKENNIKPLLENFDIMYSTYSNNEKEIKQLYKLLKFVINNKEKLIKEKFLQTVLNCLFYQKDLKLISFALDSISELVSKIFREYEDNLGELGNIFDFETINNMLIKNQNEEKSETEEALFDLYILYFSSEVRSGYKLIKEKIGNEPENIVARFIKNDQITLSVFQQNYFSNFSFVNIYNQLLVKNKNLIPEKTFNDIQFLLWTYASKINLFFSDYNPELLSEEYSESISNKTIETEIEHIFKFDSMSHISDEEIFKNWNYLFNYNPYKTAIYTFNLISKNTEKETEELNYDVLDIYSNFSNYSLKPVYLLIFLKCLIIHYIMFEEDIKS